MNILDQFRYSRDDPSQLNIKLKQDPYEKVGTSKNQNINNLLSTSVTLLKINLQDEPLKSNTIMYFIRI